MSLREFFTDWSKGDRMTGFWCLYRLRNRAKRKMIRDILTFSSTAAPDGTEAMWGPAL